MGLVSEVLADIETGLFILVGLLTVDGRNLMTGQIGGSSVVASRLSFGYLAGHTIQSNELELVLLLERGQKVVVGDAGQAERKICLAVDRLD